MKNLSNGDKVACYTTNGRFTAKVEFHSKISGMVQLVKDDGYTKLTLHRKQLRKITKKPRTPATPSPKLGREMWAIESRDIPGGVSKLLRYRGFLEHAQRFHQSRNHEFKVIKLQEILD